MQDATTLLTDYEKVHLGAFGLSVYHREQTLLWDINFELQPQCVAAIVGPVQSGKSLLLRMFNRLNDFQPNLRHEGKVIINGREVYENPEIDIQRLRRKVAMIFEEPHLFPGTIRDNVLFGVRLEQAPSPQVQDNLLEKSLKRVHLWDKLKTKLDSSPMSLPPVEQQQLCLARAIALDPIAILLDAPWARLGPVASLQLETLLFELKDHYTILFTTDNIRKAGRLSEWMAFLYKGQIIESGRTETVFTNPQHELTEKYISGRFG